MTIEKEIKLVNTFKRVSKEQILKFASWETEVILFLENHYYFKK